MSRPIQFSAFIEDMRLDALPKDVQRDVLRFVSAKAHHQFPHYGMVVKELLPKADPANLKTARKTTRGMKSAQAREFVEKKRDGKYILLLNDRIIDGHHFLAKAEHAGVTSSLNVLDLTPARFQFAAMHAQPLAFAYPPPALPEKKQKPRSGLRTAAIVAGNAGLLYGGLRVARAADALHDTARTAGGAAENVRTITDVVARPVRKLRRAFRLASLRKDVLEFREGPRKENPAAVMGVSSGITGGLLAGVPVALRRGGTLRGVLKATGSGAAVGAALGTGAALIGTKVLGKPKNEDGAAYAKRGAVGGAIGGAALGTVAGLALRKTSAGGSVLKTAARKWRPAQWVTKGGAARAAAIGAVGGGAVGGFQGADEGSGVDTLRTIRRTQKLSARGTTHRFEAPLTGKLAADRYRKKIADDDLDRRDANMARASVAGALAGLVKGGKLSRLKRAGLGALAGAGAVTAVRASTDHTKDYYGERSRGAKGLEKLPAIAGLGTAAVLAGKRLKVFGAQPGRIIRFGGQQQLRGEKNRFVNPLDVAAGTAQAYAGDDVVDLPVRHAQVIRAAVNKGQQIHRTGTRVGNLLKDAGGALTGKPKVDARGRPQKREWEKSWFKNTAGTVATAGALLGHAHLMKRNPGYRNRVAGLVKKGKETANQFVPDLFPMSHGPIIDVEAQVMTFGRSMGKTTALANLVPILFDDSAPNWDIRDERGRSARVFAPGAKPRQRREKKPHETVGFLRKAAVAGAVLAAAGGGALGYRAGFKRALRKQPVPVAPAGNIIPLPKLA